MRKFKAALFSSLIITGIFFIAGLFDGYYMLFLIVFLYAAVGNFIFGIPVSFLSDFLSKKLKKWRWIAACLIHIGAGFLTVFIIEEMAQYAVICAALFFIIDEWIRGSERKRLIFVKAVSACVLAAGSIWGVTQLHEVIRDKTNAIYLIPKGFEGSITVFYNIPNQPKLKKGGDFKIIPVEVENSSVLQGTDIEQYGMYQTSTPDMGYGLVNDQYFYIDENGKRTPIDKYCVYSNGSGAYSRNGGREIRFQTIKSRKHNVAKTSS